MATIKKILITNTMKNQALEIVKKANYSDSSFARKDKNYTTDNQIIGVLGELVFREFVLSMEYKLGEDESFLINNGNNFNIDMGDFFCSKTEKSIDIKTTITSKSFSLLVNPHLAKFRPVDYYVGIHLFPSIENKEDFDLDKVEYGVIYGSITNETLQRATPILLNGTPVIKKDYNKLSKIESLIKNNFIKESEEIFNIEKAIEYPYDFSSILNKNNDCYSFMALLSTNKDWFTTEAEISLENNQDITSSVLYSIHGMRKNHDFRELSNTLNWRTLKNNSIVFENFILIKNKDGRIVVNTQSLYRQIKRCYYVSKKKNLKLVVPFNSIISFFETKREYLIIKKLLENLSVIIV